MMDIMSLFFFSLKCYDYGLILKENIGRIKYRKWNKQAYRNFELQKFKTSDTCYVCGNGPSLRKVNLDELDGDTIVMNDHWRIANKYTTPPTFYIINDEGYGDDGLKERMLGVLNCCPERPHLFASNIGKSIEEKYGDNNTNIYYYNPIGRTYNHKRHIDFTRLTYCVWNVVSTSIQLAIYLGYKEIYLLGCDYSLFASRYMQHAYDKEEQKVKCPVVLRDMLYKYSFTTHIHYELALYARNHGIKIVNLTRESLLDAYEMDMNSIY